MRLLGSGLFDAKRHEEASSVQEAELAMLLRLGGTEASILVVQGNLANNYAHLGQREKALRMRRDVYSGTLKLYGEQHKNSLVNAYNYAKDLIGLRRFEEAKSLLRKTIPVARRVLGDSHDLTLPMRSIYAEALYLAAGATLDDLREAVTTLEDTERIARRVLGGAHPLTVDIERSLRRARAALRVRETPSGH